MKNDVRRGLIWKTSDGSSDVTLEDTSVPGGYNLVINENKNGNREWKTWRNIRLRIDDLRMLRNALNKLLNE